MEIAQTVKVNQLHPTEYRADIVENTKDIVSQEAVSDPEDPTDAHSVNVSYTLTGIHLFGLNRAG